MDRRDSVFAAKTKTYPTLTALARAACEFRAARE